MVCAGGVELLVGLRGLARIDRFTHHQYEVASLHGDGSNPLDPEVELLSVVRELPADRHVDQLGHLERGGELPLVGDVDALPHAVVFDLVDQDRDLTVETEDCGRSALLVGLLQLETDRRSVGGLGSEREISVLEEGEVVLPSILDELVIDFD